MERTPPHTTARARDLARILDSAFRVPGTRYRFGLDPILGLIPGLGDAIGGGFGFYLLFLAYRAGAPPIILIRMFGHIGLDVLLGAVPLVGDLLDVGYKANIRNLGLLERYLARPEQSTRRSLMLLVVLLALLVASVVGGIWLAVASMEALFSALA
jgi:hypothetical protein